MTDSTRVLIDLTTDPVIIKFFTLQRKHFHVCSVLLFLKFVLCSQNVDEWLEILSVDLLAFETSWFWRFDVSHFGHNSGLKYFATWWKWLNWKRDNQVPFLRCRAQSAWFVSQVKLLCIVGGAHMFSYVIIWLCRWEFWFI